MTGIIWTDRVRRYADDVWFRSPSLVLLITGALFVMGAFCVGIGGGYLWLSTQMPSHLAALVVAGGLFLLGAIIIALALLRSPRQERLASASPAAGTANADMEMLAEQIMRAAIANATETPFKAVFGAVVLGVAVGLLRERKTP